MGGPAGWGLATQLWSRCGAEGATGATGSDRARPPEEEAERASQLYEQAVKLKWSEAEVFNGQYYGRHLSGKVSNERALAQSSTQTKGQTPEGRLKSHCKSRSWGVSSPLEQKLLAANTVINSWETMETLFVH